MKNSTRINLLKSYENRVKFTIFLLLIGFLFWLFGLKLGLGQQQEVEKWKAEKHDRTNFPLTGRHRTVSCGECHLDRVFEGTPTACEVCHWERRQDDRNELRLGAHCADCHTTFSWKNVPPNKWNHISQVGYALEGIHRTLDCVDCHGESGFVRYEIGCIGCHEEDYEEAQEPNHSAAGFPAQCQLCHLNTSYWEGAEFAHDAFHLRGQHRIASCQECHFSGVYRGLPSDCEECHIKDYNETDDPDHRRLNFPTDCEQCHGTNAITWENADFRHTAFVLKGEHKTAQCTDCHLDGQYKGISSECVACHLDDYNRTDDPDHTQLGFPTDCEQCHGNGARTWQDADFTHTSFILNGQHRIIQCSTCHVDGRYVGLSSECEACHLDDYKSTSDPDHEQLGFPTDCEQCHGTKANTWDDADFDHTTIYPLQGAHKNLDCVSCHQSGYNLPKECNGCHSQDYESARNPNHRTAGFPTTCDSCHFPTHNYWSQAVFDHQFPIESGRHSGLSCTDCHLSANYRDFSCIDCHAHERAEMDSEHHDVSGYAYNSQACYACHPQGRE